MAGRRPTYVWRMDWADNGTFSGDLSGDVLDYEVRYGARTRLHGDGVRAATASGDITLDNEAGRYEPGAPNAVASSTRLRRPHAIRLLIDGTERWRGIAEPTDRSSGQRTAGWRLGSLHARALLSTTGTLELEPSTVAGLAQAFTTASGIPLAATSVQPTGQVEHAGQWLGFLGALGRFVGGWALERADGSWVLRRFVDSPSLPTSAHLTLAWGPDADALDLAEQGGHVRNVLNVRAFDFRPVAGTQDVATAAVAMIANQTRSIDISHTRVALERAEVTGFTVEGEGFTSAPVIVSSSILPGGRGVVRVRTGSLSAGRSEGTVTVTAQGTVSQRREVTPRVLESEADQDVYGRNAFDSPPWWPASHEGIITFGQTNLDNFARPPQHLAVTYSEVQASTSMSATLASACQPGNAVTFDVLASGQPVTFNGLVLDVELRGGIGRVPERRIWAVERDVLAAPALRLAVEGVSEGGATVVAQVPNPTGQRVYTRWRRVGTSIYTRPNAVASREEVPFNLSGLRSDSDYVFDAGFTNPVTASNRVAAAEFRTRQGVDRTLASVTLNGAPIQGWDFTSQATFTTGVTFDDPQGDVAIAAEATNPLATVTIRPDATATNLVNGDTATFFIDVEVGGTTNTYTLTVDVMAATLGDFDTLIGAGNRDPRGIWSDGTTMYVADSQDVMVYGYGAVSTQRTSAQDFDLPSGTGAGGMTGHGGSIWVASDGVDFVYGYDASTKARNGDNFDVSSLSGNRNRNVAGIAATATRMYVVDYSDDKVYVYRRSDGLRISGEEWGLTGSGNRNPTGACIVGGAMYIADNVDNEVYAYSIASRSHLPAAGFDLDSANGSAWGLWSDGTIIWVADTVADKLFAYDLASGDYIGD